MFKGYGDPNPVDINEWRCPVNGVSMDWIENRIVHLLETFIGVDTIYMSEDVYKQFMNSLMSKRSFNAGQTSLAGPQIVSVNTSGGSIAVKVVPGFTDFCHIGTNATYNDLVRVQVDEAFEKVFLKDCERE